MNTTYKKILFAIVFIIAIIIYFLSYTTATSVTEKLELVEPITTEIIEPIKLADERVDRINAYFTERKMPLAGYGQQFVDAADKYGIDWRLLPAISVKEQSGGRVMPYNCPNHTINYNVFGWASARICYTSFEEAIDAVSRNLGGHNPNTHSYYKGDTYSKLWSYNGTVDPAYPSKVLEIMANF